MKTLLNATNLIAAGVIAGAFATGFFSGPAFAEEVTLKSEGFQFKFAYEQSELATSDGANKMLIRLERQVKRFCANQAPTGTRLKASAKECVTRTMTDSVAGFGSAALAQAYKERSSG